MFKLSAASRVRADFSGGSISSNGGAPLLREVDRTLGLTDRVARALGDRRQRAKVRHEVLTMVRQRVHALALGYEDLNDHYALRHDKVVQTACERDAAIVQCLDALSVRAPSRAAVGGRDSPGAGRTVHHLAPSGASRAGD